MRPFLQKRLIDLLPSSSRGADGGGGGDGQLGAAPASGVGSGAGGSSKKRKAATGGAKGDSRDAEGEEEEQEEEATAAAAAAAVAAAGGADGSIPSLLKSCDVFSALLKVGPFDAERASPCPALWRRDSCGPARPRHPPLVCTHDAVCVGSSLCPSPSSHPLAAVSNNAWPHPHAPGPANPHP